MNENIIINISMAISFSGIFIFFGCVIFWLAEDVGKEIGKYWFKRGHKK